MMFRVVLWVTAAALVVGAMLTFRVTGEGGMWLAVALALMCAWFASRCGHSAPALLPAVKDNAGNELGTRWFCHDCGATWPAVFERTTTPIQKFAGYDETKLVTARERAKAHDERRQESALERAGTPSVPPDNVVAIGQRNRRR